LTNGNFEWVRVCPSLTETTPDIDNPFAESLNVEIEGNSDARLIDFPQDSAITGYNDWIWIVVKWYEGQTGSSLPGIFTDQTDPDLKSYWTEDGVYPDWRTDSDNDYIIRLYLAYDTCTTSISPCDYIIGDISGDGNRLGGDVTYGVRYFKGVGSAPKDSCYMDSTHSYLYVAGDCNGNCEFRGSDITRLVAYFKGTAPLLCCHFFPTALPRVNGAISEPVEQQMTANRAVKLDAKNTLKLSKIASPKAPWQK